MKPFVPMVLTVVLLTGCGAQAQQANQVQVFEQRMKALEQRQQELEAQLEQTQKERAELAKRIEELQAAQQAIQERQAAFEQNVEKWATDMTTALEQTQKAVAQRPKPNCKDPGKALAEAVERLNGLPSPAMLQTLADIAFREYDACMRAAGR
ncbi:hypothetical protein [Thermaerobacter subterraneus]|uniref:hypothetical protein n=1 Tax=Thermaerobacter subterraneus TaxID=175696 RepID=UPI000592C67E|nr:hypothetical protein [Thermaerobacter subterraneus]